MSTRRWIMAKQKVTLNDVAKKAGVSIAAVSRTFTPGASVSRPTKEKVERAAHALGYRPNRIARTMITGKSRIIGLLVAYLDNQFYPTALELLSRQLQAQGYHVLIFMAENDAESTPSVLQDLIDYKVDGIIMASVAISNELSARCTEEGIPVVLFNREQDDPDLYSVTSDNYVGGSDVANFLVAGGHRKIAHISGWKETSTGRDRAKGLVDGLAEHGLEPTVVVDGMFDPEVAKQQTRRIFGSGDRPDSVFVGNDHMAFAVLDVLRFELGLSIPDDVSVVGYDDVPLAGWPTYDLTTIRQPVNRMVEKTIAILLDRIGGNTPEPRTLIPGELILRGSARRPKVF